MIQCGDKVTMDGDSCTVKKCYAQGVMRTVRYPGCCVVEEKLYKNGERVRLAVGGCLAQVCREGRVEEEPSGLCCTDSDGQSVPVGGTVMKDLNRCLLSVCSERNSVKDLSLKEASGCCVLDLKLFRNGSSVVVSPCVRLRCVNTTWTATPSTNCKYLLHLLHLAATSSSWPPQGRWRLVACFGSLNY
ncbi:hypothetical protein Hamer_G017359, partial [Homarus americanus]